MGTQRVVSWLVILAGLILIVMPWLLSFATDRVAQLDAVVGGIVVAILGIIQVYALQPTPTQRLSH